MHHDHRKLAIETNQRTWKLLENPARTPAESEEMVHAAHTSLWHWLKAGTGVNHQRGAWLISRVCAELGRAVEARHYLDLTFDLTRANKADLADFDFAFAEALAARVSALEGRKDFARKHYADAKKLGDALPDEEDRKIFFDQLHAGAWFGFKP